MKQTSNTSVLCQPLSYMPTVNSPIHLLCIYGINSSLRNCKLQSHFIRHGKHAGDMLNSLSSGDSLVLHLPPSLSVPEDFLLLCHFCAPLGMRLVKATQRAHPHSHTGHLALKGSRNGSTKAIFFHPSMGVWGGLKKKPNPQNNKKQEEKKGSYLIANTVLPTSFLLSSVLISCSSNGQDPLGTIPFSLLTGMQGSSAILFFQKGKEKITELNRGRKILLLFIWKLKFTW